jgi:hypothetical protein
LASADESVALRTTSAVTSAASRRLILIRYRRNDGCVFLYAFDLIELNGDNLRRGSTTSPSMMQDRDRSPARASTINENRSVRSLPGRL